MKALRSVFIAHYKQFIRDRTALFFSFIFPIMFILIFGWAFRNPGVQNFDVGLVDQGSPQSAILIEKSLGQVIIKGEKTFKVTTGDLDAQLKKLRDGDLDAVIIIPKDLDSAALLKQPVALQVYYDPSQTAQQQILIPILNEVVNEIDRGIQGTVTLISIDPKPVQSHDLRYIDYLVPGILGMTLMFTGIFGSLTIIQQREAHIIKRLGCTPLRRSTLVFGELFFRMLIVIMTAALIILVGWLAFDVKMIGNWGSLCGIIILGTLVFTSLGYLIAAFVKTVESADPILNFITFPMMFLSGTFFEVKNMPGFIEPVVKAMPLTYLNDALRQIMVDGSPLHSMTTDIAVMVGWVVVCLGVTIRFFRWD